MRLRKATKDDLKILLDWRNDVQTRIHSKNMDLIEEESHLKWFDSILKNPRRNLFIAIHKGTRVGTVRADEDEKAYELSWTVSPDFRGKGLGKRMVKLLADKVRGKIRAEIKEENIPSKKIAKFVGMKLQKKENGILHYST